MAWSIFNQGGGKGSAVTWARDLLAELGAPDTPATEQFVYDWEVSEGGGGKYNPLNQGPVPGHSELTSTGPQYGGGAADFVSWDAGLTGAVDYINMPNYKAVKAALMNGDAVGARQALIASPWAASHYDNGAGFSNDPLPNQASALPGYTGGNGTNATLTSSPLDVFNPIQWVMDALGISTVRDLLERAALIVLGAVLIIIAVLKFTDVGTKFKGAFVTAAGVANPASKEVGTAAGAAVKRTVSTSSESKTSKASESGKGSAGKTDNKGASGKGVSKNAAHKERKEDQTGDDKKVRTS